jgi:hypothetical protein
MSQSPAGATSLVSSDAMPAGERTRLVWTMQQKKMACVVVTVKASRGIG